MTSRLFTFRVILSFCSLSLPFIECDDDAVRGWKLSVMRVTSRPNGYVKVNLLPNGSYKFQLLTDDVTSSTESLLYVFMYSQLSFGSKLENLYYSDICELLGNTKDSDPILLQKQIIRLLFSNDDYYCDVGAYNFTIDKESYFNYYATYDKQLIAPSKKNWLLTLKVVPYTDLYDAGHGSILSVVYLITNKDD